MACQTGSSARYGRRWHTSYPRLTVRVSGAHSGPVHAHANALPERLNHTGDGAAGRGRWCSEAPPPAHESFLPHCPLIWPPEVHFLCTFGHSYDSLSPKAKAINQPVIVEKVMENIAILAGQLLPEGFFGVSPNLPPKAYDRHFQRKPLLLYSHKSPAEELCNRIT